MPRASRLVAGCCLAAASAIAAPPRADRIETRRVVAAIQRIEDQVAAAASARCEFTVTYVPTSPRARKIIRAANQFRARAPDVHVLEAAEAGRASYRSVWVRKGARQREERTYSTGQTRRFVVRWDAATLADINMIQPYSFVFEYRGWPLSEWLRRATRREVATGTVNGQERAQISLIADTSDAPLMVLTYDAMRRLVAREIYLDGRNFLIEHTRQIPRLYTRHEFFEHKAYDDAQGNKIWIPSKATLHYYVGETSDGTPLEEFAIRVEIEKLELNVEVPDDAFKPETPPIALWGIVSDDPHY